MLEQDPLPEAKAEDDVLRAHRHQGARRRSRSTEIEDYDPEGDNDGESRTSCPSSSTARRAPAGRTELYRSAAFGDLKTGVGLDFTLEEEATIIEIVSPVEGWKGELLQTISSGGAARLAHPRRRVEPDHHPARDHHRGPDLVHRAGPAHRGPVGRRDVGDHASTSSAAAHRSDACALRARPLTRIVNRAMPAHQSPTTTAAVTATTAAEKQPVGAPHHHAFPIGPVRQGAEGPGVHGHRHPPRLAHGPGQQRDGVAARARPDVQEARPLPHPAHPLRRPYGLVVRSGTAGSMR